MTLTYLGRYLSRQIQQHLISSDGLTSNYISDHIIPPRKPNHHSSSTRTLSVPSLLRNHAGSGRLTTRRITLSVNNPEVEEQDLRLVTLDVYPDMTLGALRSSIEAEGIPAPAQHLYHNGHLITDDSKTLQDLQITDGDMLALHVRDMRGTNVTTSHRDPGAQRRPPAGPGAPGSSQSQDPELIRLQVLGDPALRAQLERLNPTLAATIEDPARFAQIFQQSSNQQEEARQARMREIAALNADEFNPEAQAKIEDMIRQQGVMENLQNAMEHNPECASPRLLFPEWSCLSSCY
ncbi:hypothetical protein F5Y18DRAFT_38296 [Xylariaceae sp. FL1019]|nr:hypothetical protein F5Y18DRAFT_38296 [Xylariaceae sp. FL1019]